MKIVDLENDYFLVRFREDDDYLKALMHGPWVIFGQVLSIQRWVPTFRSSQGHINRAVVLIRFPDLSIVRYHPRILTILGNLVGTMVRIDEATLQAHWGNFTRLVVDIDLSSPLRTGVELDGETILVAHEGLPQLCYTRGMVGHEALACPQCQQTTPESPNPTVGAGSLGTTTTTAATGKKSNEYGPWI
ncbi:hypothetical protein K2173_005487 [Erythroxylum novogranatense]|uniref:DUF4283 domain-containing protein n=1 Tax=Erythroxylum novogranatense TaxID=1862640 RepID=A0AAV8SKW4_9ROSI|nr:hypothetical protein K2173_005487 [Erythroxylum novogranatense]